MSSRGEIMTRLIAIKEEMGKLTAEQEALWKRFFEFADDIAGEGKKYRWLNRELGMVMGRIMAQPSPVLDTTALLEDPALSLGARRAITKRVVVVDNNGILSYAGKNKEFAALVAKHTVTPEKQVRRYGPAEATKEEKAALEADIIG